jgi:hypothetical protein
VWSGLFYERIVLLHPLHGDDMTIRERLKSAGARTDGLCWDRDGRLIFVATRANGPWSDGQKDHVCRALGRVAALTIQSSAPALAR